MEHSTLSPVARTPGRFVRPAVLLGALSALFVLSPGAVRAADQVAPAPAGGPPYAGNPARDMPTGDLPELTAPPPVLMAAPPPPRPDHAGPATATHRLGSLIDRDVVAPDGGHVGQVIDVLLDQEGHPAAIVVDVGGFLGVGNRRIAIAWDAFAMGGLTEKSPVKLRIDGAGVRSAAAYDPTSMDVTVVQAPPPAPVVPPAPAAAPVAPVMAPAEAEPGPVSVEPQPVPPPLVPPAPGAGGDGPPAGHAAAGRSGFMAR
ncbi:PRC-barrel domain-containing protein [Gluconacetobacter takamatsuzukensis]|uniref:PRC-barrel domain containing protein n=1 Tax=Gluconacetobacter takamatsuzukensis TaxID=1286190 RepID=A0A7W4PQ62_9PROT|nr:PRC-barrel domain-containing protein [Gluconacetobacter takamatsuzukensis]MBB2205988.1 PRC-barrel domain containing protein [Gluconacetobacter takamatsuzukensis]